MIKFLCFPRLVDEFIILAYSLPKCIVSISLYHISQQISSMQMTTAISIEDVRREVKILKALSGHKHLVRYYDACEDANNVYIIME